MSDLEFIEKAGGGSINTIITGPQVLPQFAQCKEDMRALHAGLEPMSAEYKNWPSAHVEAGRDMAARHMLDCDYDWSVQIDADAVFQRDLVLRLLKTAYETHPQADMVGAYAQLKNPPYLPTVDTGTGRWEEHYPHSGVMSVIRTGTHAFLIKRSAFQKMGPAPWFRTRRTMRPVDAMAEVDNYMRMNYDGKNPLAGDAWEEALEQARENSDAGPSHVGEDSGLCDRLRANGGQIVVNTDIVTGHVKTKTVGPSDLKEQMQERRMTPRLASGIREEP